MLSPIFVLVGSKYKFWLDPCLMIFKTPTRIYKFLPTTKDRKWIRTKTDDTKPKAVYLVFS